MKTPVVLILFRRADLTAEVWRTIRQQQPERLFIIADGPRTPEESGKCSEARKVVENVDWRCDVRRNYVETNLGCRNRIVSGLDWVFSQVNEAIILEDDCLPSQSFFGFCGELLERYRDEERVMQICGSNFLPHRRMTSYSYYFSKYAHVWGWATWARAWKQMDLEMDGWKEFTKRKSKLIFNDAMQRKHWIHKLRPLATGERQDSWGYPWQFSVWSRGGLCIAPQTNLVSNTGHRADGTHTRTKSDCANLPLGELATPLKHPVELRINEEADNQTFYETMEGKRLLLRRTWRYRLLKPLRIWRKLRGYQAGTV